MRLPLVAALAVASLMSVAPPTRAAESFEGCAGFVTTLPAVITTPGVWCLNHDVATTITSGDAIYINSNNVTLDCNHFRIGGLGAGPASMAHGVFATSRSNTTVRNCNVRGFRYGIRLDGFSSVVEDNRVEGSLSFGIHVSGDAGAVRRNLIVDTGGTGSATAVYVNGDTDVLDNTIDGVSVPLNYSALGVHAAGSSTSAMIGGNRIRGITAPAGNTYAAGIVVATLASWLVADNHIVDASSGPSAGIDCGAGSTTVTRNNTLRGWSLSACSYSSGDVVVP